MPIAPSPCTLIVPSLPKLVARPMLISAFSVPFIMPLITPVERLTSQLFGLSVASPWPVLRAL
ncbi:hypothetical protein D3C81_1175590 [compost metagenome]